MTDAIAARTLIQTAELPALQSLGADADGGVEVAFDSARAQALVVGSDVVSFTIGVEADFRQAIADSALFAKLVAGNKVGEDADPMRFFDAYFATLTGLGWLVQKRDTAEFSYKGTGFDVHEAVIGVITAFLMPIGGAASAVLTVLKGLHEMNSEQPFITLFNKRSRHGKIGKFQFTYVHQDPDHGLAAEVMAFALDAKENITQVLFFKLTKGETTLRRSLGTLSIDTQALHDIRPNLAAKVKAYRTALIAEADLGPVPGK